MVVAESMKRQKGRGRVCVAANEMGQVTNDMLAHEILTSVAPAPATTLFLHGILARRQNLRSFAKLFVSHSHCNALLVDHRGHGGSPPMTPPHTIQACVHDLTQLIQRLHPHYRVTQVVGHSFGGKVALEFAACTPSVESCIVLDSPPGPWQNISSSSHDSVERLFALLPALRCSSGTQLAHELEHTHGFSRMVALWMTTNYKGPGVWAFDYPVAQALFHDYASRDLFPLLDTMHTPRVKFIRAEKNRAWTRDVLDHFARLDKKRVTLTTAVGCGHWLHAEKPEYVYSLCS